MEIEEEEAVEEEHNERFIFLGGSTTGFLLTDKVNQRRGEMCCLKTFNQTVFSISTEMDDCLTLAITRGKEAGSLGWQLLGKDKVCF